ncbi:MAG: chromosome segregation protein SMC [bacterium]|nr:chromosome segregation protein SMC [bacterium]
MKLKRVELQGFKSFVDRTVLEFDQGITAILGPNGCGKSNIVDAIRWVLGEQSAKQLRGTVMEDIIFKGTARRKPVGLCEVALTFTNDNRAMRIEYDEVTIKRRVTRDGFSQYYLNDAPVRLKDLRDLFFDTGVNNTAYSVIEQEKIGRILNENSQEVRLLVEEGAGIVRYKARRKEAQRKLDQTEQDLLRLRDISEEIGREVRSLQRQVGKARRYQRLYAQSRALDLLLAGRAVRRMDQRELELRERRQELAVLAESDSGELAELRARIEATRPAVDEREAERHGLEESLQAFEEQLRAVEQKSLLLEHRIGDHQRRLQESTESVADICRRRETAHAELHDLADRKQGLTARSADLTADLARLQEDLQLIESRYDADRGALEKASQLNLEFIETDNRRKSELRELEIRRENRHERLRVLEQETAQQQEARRREEARLQEAAARQTELAEARRGLLGELSDAERRLQESQAERARLRDEVSLREARSESLRSRHELLKRITESLHGYGGAAREVLQTRRGDPGILGSLAEQLTVDEGWTAAFETLLGDVLDSVVVSDDGKALDLVRLVREAEKGRASFLVADARPGVAGPPPPPSGRPATDLVRGDGAATPHLRRLLSRVWAFETDEAALDAAARHGAGDPVACLSRTGLLITSDGLVRGGRGKSEEVSLLGRGEKLERLQEDLARLAQEIAEHTARVADAVQAEQTERARIQAGRGRMEDLDRRLGRVHVDEAEARSRIDGAQQRLAAIARDAELAQDGLRELAHQEAGLRGNLDESGRLRSDSGVRVDELRSAVKQSEQAREAARAEAGEKKLLQSRHQGELRELEAALAHRRESVAEMTSAEERLRQEIVSLREELAGMEEEIVSRRAQLEAGLDERERRRLLVQASAEAISGLHQETAAWHDRVRAIESQRTACRDESHGLETEQATMEVRRANLVERIEEQYKGRFRELVRAVDPEALPPELERDGDVFQEEQARALLEDSRAKLEELGAVNHLAVEEYEQKRERLTFLEEQVADVEAARKDLAQTIDKINRTARKLFQETFEEIRRNYVAVFQTLFEGGRADLELEQTDDPLESNINIVAQPRGKRVDHIRLLSGGERCLTALSLLFAVYLVKPSPFCLLDEADAPLDDANVQRFVRLLREFSAKTQFLVVTHNKLTMETANHLYGVTMMEEGVSSLVSVSFRDVAEAGSDADLGQAIAARRRQIDESAEERAVLATPPGTDVSASRFVLDADDADDEADDIDDVADDAADDDEDLDAADEAGTTAGATSPLAMEAE